ncbi:MAG: polysaccharide pyruvyl transferase family protein [Candidatus Hinthialibacter antarcticus]|nr:polysaccharide pyruvyl transferase family protein [Candidatus Hinthialibacter antarcticus]
MEYHSSRRQFLSTAALAAISAPTALSQATPKTILLRSSWQDVNIGDIAHTPGMIEFIKQRLPGVRVILWPNQMNGPVASMLYKKYPKLKIVKGDLKNGEPYERDLKQAFEDADLFLHGSGAGFYTLPHMQAWKKRTGKPYGVFGVTFSSVKETQKEILNSAAFLFCRETHSIKNLREAGIHSPVIDFAPDATFNLNLSDDAKATAYMKKRGLVENEFICCVPRLRYTPYHLMRMVGWSEDEILQKTSVNELHKEADHAKMRAAIVRWVRETGKKALLCPEMTYQIALLKPMLFDPLPDDVKKNVVIRQVYWRPDEAASVYRRAFAVISMECHSPIIAAVNGTPFMYLRQPQDTIKGQMYYDIGADDWVFEIEESTGVQISDRLMEMASSPEQTKNDLANAMEKVNERYKAAAKIMQDFLPL